MHVETLRSWVEDNHVLLHFTDAAYRRFKDLLNEDSLLWMHHLVVAFLQLAVDVDVLDV